MSTVASACAAAASLAVFVVATASSATFFASAAFFTSAAFVAATPRAGAAFFRIFCFALPGRDRRIDFLNDKQN
jgi:hypothetical protein